MHPKVSAYIAASLDGFIARNNGDLDWLCSATDQAGEDYGFHAFLDSVDVLVMGRRTFEKVLTFGAWPYGDKKVVVLSTGAPAIPPSLQSTVTVLFASPQGVIERLSSQGARHLYVDGGVTIQRFIAAGLVDEMTLRGSRSCWATGSRFSDRWKKTPDSSMSPPGSSGTDTSRAPTGS